MFVSLLATESLDPLEDDSKERLHTGTLLRVGVLGAGASQTVLSVEGLPGSSV